MEKSIVGIALLAFDTTPRQPFLGIDGLEDTGHPPVNASTLTSEGSVPN
jgi:hypothetical protein